MENFCNKKLLENGAIVDVFKYSELFGELLSSLACSVEFGVYDLMNYLLEGGATSNLSQVRGINLLRLALLNDKKDGNGVGHIMYNVLLVEG